MNSQLAHCLEIPGNYKFLEGSDEDDVTCALHALAALGLASEPTDYELVFIYPPLRALPPWNREVEHRVFAGAGDEEKIALYIHLPFCTGQCTYCHYLTARTRKRADVWTYLDLITTEMDLWRAHLGRNAIQVTSVHMGGGTPTYLAEDEFAALANNFRQRFSLCKGYQWTVEAAPETITSRKLDLLRDCGVNRISIGIESLNDRLLSGVNRRHDSTQALDALEAAQGAGFEEINVDLMYGLPAQDLDDWLATLEGVVTASRPSSLSLYRLRLRSETALGRAYLLDGASMPGASTLLEWRAAARAMLEGAGYRADPVERYHLSRARGNRYQRETWSERRSFLAIGPSGYWYLGGAVGVNVRDMKEHARTVRSGHLPIAVGRLLDSREHVIRRFVPGLKYADGIAVDEASRWLYDARQEQAVSVLRILERAGLVAILRGRATLTRAGELVADEILPLFYEPRYRERLAGWENRFGQYW